MKAYVIITGALFGVLTIAHVVRIVTENPRLAMEPFFVVLCIWALLLVRRSRKTL